jgi:hypothetical protein
MRVTLLLMRIIERCLMQFQLRCCTVFIREYTQFDKVLNLLITDLKKF